MSTGGEVANALVCKTSIRGFDPRPVLHNFNNLNNISQDLNTTKTKYEYCWRPAMLKKTVDRYQHGSVRKVKRASIRLEVSLLRHGRVEQETEGSDIRIRDLRDRKRSPATSGELRC
jgi:hypothetical protein